MVLQKPVYSVAEVPRDLGHERISGMPCYTGDVNASRLQVDNEEDVVRLESERRPHLHREEVCRRDLPPSEGIEFMSGRPAAVAETLVGMSQLELSSDSNAEKRHDQEDDHDLDNPADHADSDCP